MNYHIIGKEAWTLKTGISHFYVLSQCTFIFSSADDIIARMKVSRGEDNVGVISGDIWTGGEINGLSLPDPEAPFWIEITKPEGKKQILAALKADDKPSGRILGYTKLIISADLAESVESISITVTDNICLINPMIEDDPPANYNNTEMEACEIKEPVDGFDYFLTACTAIDVLLDTFTIPAENVIYPTYWGYADPNDRPDVIPAAARYGSPWERFEMLAALESYLRLTEVVPKQNPADVSRKERILRIFENEAAQAADPMKYDPALLSEAGNPAFNTAADDCGWTLMWLTALYRHAEKREDKDALIGLAKSLFRSVYKWYEPEDGGVWYRMDDTYRKEFYSVYAASICLGGLEIASLCRDGHEYARCSREIYDGINRLMRRRDGLYWTDYGYAGALRKHTPYAIGEAGSVSFIAGNMAMAVLAARFGDLSLTRSTAGAIARFQTMNNGFMNDRDAWTNATFAGLYVTEALPVLTEDARECQKALFGNTARSIMNHALEKIDGKLYFRADWYGGCAWTSKGSVSKQIMTSANTAHMAVAAALAHYLYYKNSSIELLQTHTPESGRIKAIIFDFDGTISTLRHGWEQIMRPLMIEAISGGTDVPGLSEIIDSYIDSSTGIQTVYQMMWLKEQAEKFGLNPAVRDVWEYKDEYNRRLMNYISGRIAAIETHVAEAEDFMIEGSRAFIKTLADKGIKLYLASGTDHRDVIRESEMLGMSGYFTLICGAPEREVSCSKEKVIRTIINENNLRGENLAIIGDGKVEIALGKENGAFTLGMATNEDTRRGVNPVKYARLVKAGADAVAGDFSDKDELVSLFGISTVN